MPISEWRSHLHGDTIWGLNPAWNPCLPKLLELFFKSSGACGWASLKTHYFVKLQPTYFVPVPTYPDGRKIDDILFPSVVIRHLPGPPAPL